MHRTSPVAVSSSCAGITAVACSKRQLGLLVGISFKACVPNPLACAITGTIKLRASARARNVAALQYIANEN